MTAHGRYFALTLITIGLAACGAAKADEPPTTPVTSPATTAAPTTTAAPGPTTVAPTTTTAPQALSRDALLATQKCVDALIDDPRDPGANFSRGVARASIGRSTVPELDEAHALCKEAASQLKADQGAVGSPSFEMLGNVEYINKALLLAEQQIASDTFIDDATCPDKLQCPITVMWKSIIIFQSQTYSMLN